MTAPEVFAEEREQTILRLLKEKKRITVTELVELFDTSGTTVRKYLNDLETAGKLIRTHGGAICLDEALREESVEAKKVRMIAEKRSIAEEARKYISDGDIIMLGGGTTILELARLLHGLKSLVVITNSIPAAAELYPDKNIEVQICGGTVREKTGVVVGPQSEKAIEELFADKTFIGADSISLEFGLTTPNCFEAQVERQLVSHGKTVFVLADHTKMNKVTLARQTSLEDIDYIITDKQTDSQMIHELEAAGITIVAK